MSKLRTYLTPGWLAGIGLALTGVLISRCIASHCPVEHTPWVRVCGQLTAFSGLFLIAYTIKTRAAQRTREAARVENT